VAAFYADENFPLPVVEALRRLGHEERQAAAIDAAVRGIAQLQGSLIRINLSESDEP